MKRSIILILLSIAVFTAAIFAFPEEARAIRLQAENLCEEGVKLFEMNKIAEAESKFKAAIEQDGSYDKPYYYMAQVCDRQANYEQALDYLKKALRNSPHEDIYKYYQCEINNKIALDAVKNGNNERAVKIYNANLEALPYHLPTYNRLAILAINKGDYNAALLQCNKAIESSQQAPPTVKIDQAEIATLHTNMANCFFELKNYARAISEIESAKKTRDTPYVQRYYKKIMGEDNPVFLELKKADEAFAAGNLKAAREGYEKVLKLYANCTPAVEKLSIISKHDRIEGVVAEGDRLAAAGQFMEAAEKYSEALLEDPTRAPLKDKIKDMEEKQKKADSAAIASVKKKQVSSGGTSSSELVDQRLRAMALKDLQSNPNLIYETKFNEAEELFKQEKYDEALAALKDIQEKKPDFKTEEINKRIRSIYTARGEVFIEYFDAAVPKLYIYIGVFTVVALIIWVNFGGQLMLMFKPDPQKHFKAGIDYLDKEKYDSAAASFEKALKTVFDPIERTKIKAKLAYSFFKLKDYDKCVKVSQEVLDVDPKNDSVHGYLGNSYLEKNIQSERAISEYKLLLRKQKDDKRIIALLCTHFLKEDNLSQEAIDVYQKVFASDPKDKRVRKMLCEAFIRSNDKTELAVKVYESVLEDEPNRKDVKLMLIIAYFNKKNYEECVRLCGELFERGDIENISLEYYTNSFTKLGKKGQLYDDYQALAAKFPDNAVLRTYLDKMQSVLAVERLTSPGASGVAFDKLQQTSAAAQQASGQPSMPQRAPAVNICKKCAHMNPVGLSVCEKCSAPI